MRDIERAVIWCYTIVLFGKAANILRGSNLSIYEQFNTIYDNFLHTNLFVSIVVHPWVLLFRQTVGRVYQMRASTNFENDVSFEILLDTLAVLSTWGFATVIGLCMTYSSMVDLSELGAQVAYTAAFTCATGISAAILMLLTQRFPAVSHGAHLALLVAGVATDSNPTLKSTWSRLMILHGGAQIIRTALGSTDPIPGTLFHSILTAGGLLTR
jgi:hypothetical protein